MKDEFASMGSESLEDVDNILGLALFALGYGARGLQINLPAIQSFRRQFAKKISSAVHEPDWRHKWRSEKAYLVSCAGAMGQRAARLAAEEGRTFITEQDLDMAMMKIRGHLPIAGRWCPF